MNASAQDSDPGLTDTQQASDDAMFFHDLALCLLIAAVLIILGMVLGVTLVKAGMAA